MGAFVILMQIASHWPQFGAWQKGMCRLRDDNSVAAASKQASNELKHFHAGVELYHFAPVFLFLG